MSSALANRHRLRVRYVTSSDVVSEREIDPVALHTQDAYSYLLAWCHRAQGQRTFRLDRLLAATELDVPTGDHDLPTEVDFTPTGDAPLATITFASPARWVAEQVPVEKVRNLPDGAFEVSLRVTNPVWLRRLLLEHARHVLAVAPRRSPTTWRRPRAPPWPRTGPRRWPVRAGRPAVTIGTTGPAGGPAN